MSTAIQTSAWYDHLAGAARGKVTAGSTKSFFHVTGIDLGHGVFTTWMNAGRTRLAEATRGGCSSSTGKPGKRRPRRGWPGTSTLLTAVSHVSSPPTPLSSRLGGEEALERAIKICDEALGTWDGSTAYGSPALRAERGRRKPEPPRLTGPEYFLSSLSYE